MTHRRPATTITLLCSIVLVGACVGSGSRDDEAPGDTVRDGGGDIAVDMGQARLDWRDIPLAGPADTLHLRLEAGPFKDPVAVGMGNPHAVFFVDDAEAAALETFGPVIERHEMFPRFVNVGAAQVLSGHEIRLRVWERGAGITRACGSGACAALVAAPPAGATKQADLNLFSAAERYHALLELGKEMGVTPQVELWGFSQSMKRLGELVFVAAESGHPDACMLPDVYHIYKGGSDFEGLRMINGAAIHVFHMNDYPDNPPRATIGDAHRVYPGDGVAPLSKILRDIDASGFRGMLSLELFNRDYWQQDALDVARTGLEKMREAVQKAFA